MEGLGPVAAAAAAFVGTLFLMSHPLRKPIVDTVGSAVFLGIYSAVAAATHLSRRGAVPREPANRTHSCRSETNSTRMPAL